MAENNHFITVLHERSGDWNYIKDQFPGKWLEQWQRQVEALGLPLRAYNWTRGEDNRLLDLADDDILSLEEIADEIPGRDKLSCGQRITYYYNLRRH